MNICLCGAQDGYPHAETCPFPYFGNDPAKIERWDREEARLRGLVVWSRYHPDPDTFPLADLDAKP